MDAAERHRQAARLHVENIDQGFLATLGVGFVALMYRAIDESRDAVLLVEEADGRIAGFVAGGAGMGSIYRRMLRHPVALAWHLGPTLLRPRRWLRILEILRYGRDVAPDALPREELLSLAVDRAHRGTGIAERLYARLVRHFGETGTRAFRITVGDSLGPAHRFYRRMGAQPVLTTKVHGEQTSTVYLHTLN